MKYVFVFLIVCVALAAAAPQFFGTWPYFAPYDTADRTIVAGPTVYNRFDSRFADRFF